MDGRESFFEMTLSPENVKEEEIYMDKDISSSLNSGNDSSQDFLDHLHIMLDHEKQDLEHILENN